MHYGWFLQNLGKGCIRTNMHTTVDKEAQWGSKDVNEITFDYLQVLFSSFNQKIYG